MNLRFDPGPKFQFLINEKNVEQFTDIDKAIHFLSFQRDALITTRTMLPTSKSLIGFIGGPWTLMNYACESKISEKFKLKFIETTLIPLLKRNIELQINAGAEKVMIFHSGLKNMSRFPIRNIFTEIPAFQRQLTIAETCPKNVQYWKQNGVV